MSKADQLRQLREANHARGTNRQADVVRQHHLDRQDAVPAKAGGAAEPQPKVAAGVDLCRSSVSKQSKSPGSVKRGGRPLAKDADKATERTKPWRAEGISRRTWYRRQAEKKS